MDIEEVLKENGYRATSQRMLLYDIFMENKSEHLTVDTINHLIKEKGHNMGTATIYRNLDIFTRLGFVGSIDDKYEILIKEKDGIFPHFICSKCKKIVYVGKDLNLMDEIESMAKKKGFEIDNISLRINGICKKCK